MKIIRSFGEDIYGNKFAINESNQEEADLVEYIVKFDNKTRPKNKDDKKVKKLFLIMQYLDNSKSL